MRKIPAASRSALSLFNQDLQYHAITTNDNVATYDDITNISHSHSKLQL